MFEGVIVFSLDVKGWFVILVRYCEFLFVVVEGLFVLMVYLYCCLLFYFLLVWQLICDQIFKVFSFDLWVVLIKCVLVGNVCSEEFDLVGCILVVIEFCEYVYLEKIVYLVGMGLYFEIWSEVGWK